MSVRAFEFDGGVAAAAVRVCEWRLFAQIEFVCCVFGGRMREWGRDVGVGVASKTGMKNDNALGKAHSPSQYHRLRDDYNRNRATGVMLLLMRNSSSSA